MEFKIEKEVKGKKVLIKIEPLKLSESGQLELCYSFPGQKYEVGKFSPHKKALIFPLPEKINGVKASGISLPDNICHELEKIQKHLKQEQKAAFDEAFEKALTLRYYNGDWYRTIGFWAKDASADDEIKERIKKENDYWLLADPDKIAEQYFNLKRYYSKEEVEKVTKQMEQKGFQVKIILIGEEKDTGYIKEITAPWGVWKEQIFKPLVEKVKEKERKRAEEYQNKLKKALKKAKETGKPQIVQVLGHIDGDDREEVKRHCPQFLKDFGELGVITVYEVVYPDGKITEEYSPSY